MYGMVQVLFFESWNLFVIFQ